MDIELVKKEKNYAEFLLKGEKHSFPTLLKFYLLKDSSVVFASYELDHPVIGTPRFIVRTDGKKSAEKALEDAIKALIKDLKELQKVVKK